MNQDFISVHEIKDQLSNQDACTIIDVREFSEFTSEHIEESRHTPLSDFSNHIDELDKGHTYYILCRSGNRACKAAETLHQRGFHNFKVIEGGIEAWKKAGLQTRKQETNVWSLERQVRFTAGLFVMAGLILGYWVTPYAYFVSAFVSGGLMFSAITDTCGMGLMLAKMPWNR